MRKIGRVVLALGVVIAVAAVTFVVWLETARPQVDGRLRLASLEFDPKPDGRLESRYQIAGVFEGLLTPRFLQAHFELHDFTPFHDEIRKVSDKFLVGKYMTAWPPGVASLLGSTSMGVVHSEPGSGQFGFYSTLTRMEAGAAPT